MNEEAILELYNELSTDYEVGDINQFKAYLQDPEYRVDFFEQVIKPIYEVEDIADFEAFYGLKKKGEKDGASPSGAGFSVLPEGEKDTLLERTVGKNFITDFFGDIYRAGVQGLAQGATVDDALKLFYSGKDVDEEDLQDYITAVQEMESFAPSDEMQEFDEIYQKEGGGIMGFIKGISANPTVIPQIFTSSMFAMLNKGSLAAGAAGGVGAGLATGGIGAIPGAIFGLSGALETGVSFTEFLKEELGDKAFTEENIKTVLENDEALSNIRRKAGTRGITIAGIDALTAGVARKVGAEVVGTLGKGLTGATRGVVEAVGGATGEATARALAGQEMDVAEIGFEGIAGTATAPLTIGERVARDGVSYYKLPKYSIDNKKVTREEFIKEIEVATPERILTMQASTKNDAEVSDIMNNAYQDANIKIKNKEALPGITEEELDKIVSLTKEQDKLKENGSVGAKARLKTINKQINQITNAVQERSTEKIPLQKSPKDSAEVGEGDKPVSTPAGKDTPKGIQEEEVIVEDKKTQEKPEVKEKFETKRIKITEPFTIGTVQVLFNEDGSIKSIINKRTNKEVAASTRPKYEKIILEKVIDIDAGEKAPIIEGIKEEEGPSYIADNSNNVREIAETIRAEEDRIKKNKELQSTLIEEQDLNNLLGLEFTSKSWERLTGKTPKQSKIEKVWINDSFDVMGQPEGLSLEDGWLSRFAKQDELPVDTSKRLESLGITVEEVIQFIKQNNTDAKIKKAKKKIKTTPKTPSIIELEVKFEELTGAKPTPTNIDLVVGIEEGRVPVEILKLQEQQELKKLASEPGVFGKKRGPSAKKIVGNPKKMITVDDAKARTDQIRLEVRAARQSKANQTTRRKALSNAINALQAAGKINIPKAKSLIKKISTVDLDKAINVERVLSYVDKVFKKAVNDAKLNQAKDLRDEIKTLAKREKLDISPRAAAERFTQLDLVLIEDIDDYIKRATAVRDGVKPSTKQKIMPALDIKVTDEYTAAETNKAREIKTRAEKEVFEDLTGLSPEQFSFEEMREIVHGVEQEQSDSARMEELKTKSKAKAEIIRKGLNTAFNTVSTLVNQLIETETDPFTGEKFTLSPQDKKLIKDFINIDINKISEEDAVIALDSLINFATNKTTGGMEAIVERDKGRIGVETMKSLGIIAKPLSAIIKADSGIARKWVKYIATLPLQLELMFKGQNKASKFETLSGFADVKTGVSRGNAYAQEIADKYYNKFIKSEFLGPTRTQPNGENFNSLSNDIERGVFAFIRRTIPGEEDVEFQRRKVLVEETIEKLQSRGGKQAKIGDAVQEVYNKILKDAKNVSEVESKVDKINIEAVEWMTEIWKENFNELSRVNLNIYNKILGKDINYTHDSFIRLQDIESDIKIGEEPIFNVQRKRVSDKKTGVLMDVKRPVNLPAERVLNFSFDSQNINSLRQAKTEIETAGPIQQVKGFTESKDFEKIIPTQEDRDLLKQRLAQYVEAKKGREYIGKDDSSLLRLINNYAGFAVSRTLGGITQAPKQVLPVLVNTLINAGPEVFFGNLNILGDVANNSAMAKFLQNSGYSVVQRGLESSTTLESNNTKLENEAKGGGKKLARGFRNLQRGWLQTFLVKPDRYVAQASWMMYYIKSLKEQGVNVENINWETHEVNKKAGNYAQQQVDRQQNISDADLQGEIFRSKNPGIQLVRRTLLPFANFLLNQKTRMYSDITALSSKTSERGDKQAALRSLGGLIAETVAFNALGLFISQALASMSSEDDEKEKKKREKFKNRLKGRAGQTIKDVLAPLPIGVVEGLLIDGINAFISGISESDDPFQFFEMRPEDDWQKMGIFSIPIERANEWNEMRKMAFEGTFEKKGAFGKSSTKKIKKRYRDEMLANYMVYTLYASGILPAEAGTIARYNTKAIKDKTKK